MKKLFGAVAAGLVIAALGMSACDREGPAERAGKKIDEAVEKAGDKVDEAKDEVEDALDE